MLETIYHPGHYRVALAVNSPTELPLDPESDHGTERSRPAFGVGQDSGPGADAGARRRPLRPHTAKIDTPLETDVQLPNISCKRCTLQVIQFMAEHAFNNPGGNFAITTARSCRSPRIRRSRSTSNGRLNADRPDDDDQRRTRGIRSRKIIALRVLRSLRFVVAAPGPERRMLCLSL